MEETKSTTGKSRAYFKRQDTEKPDGFRGENG